MGRKHRRRGSRNLIRHIFVLIRRFVRHLQRPSIPHRKRRKRRQRQYNNLISPVFALGGKFFSNGQKPFTSQEGNYINTKKDDGHQKFAKLEIESQDRGIKIIRIQK